MALELDFSSHFAFYPNRVKVNFASAASLRAGPDSADEISLDGVKRRAISKRELAASNGAYTGADVNWWIPAELFEGKTPPEPGCIVTDEDDVEWTVLETQLGKFGATYKCVSRNMVIAYALRDLITIELPGVTYDAAGAVVRKWPTEGGRVLYRDLVCRVQPKEATVVSERGITGQETAYTIYCSRQLTKFDVRECRIKWTTHISKVDKYLDAVSYADAEQIGALPRIEAELKVQ